jgi:hypothetical protein
MKNPASLKTNAAFALILASTLTTLSACGAGDASRKDAGGDSSKTIDSSSSMTGDSALSEQVIAESVADGIASLADQGTTSTSLNLAGAERESSVTKSCAVDGSNAVVTVSSEINHEIERDGKNVSFTRVMTGSGTQTRTWSRTKDGAAVSVECGPGGKSAKIDWKEEDLAGLKLDMEFSRTRSVESTMVNNRRGTTRTTTSSFSVSGKRSSLWGEVVDGAEQGFIVREKTVTSSVTRKLSAKNSQNLDRNLEFTVATAENAPLQVRVSRSISTSSVDSKLIRSGTIVASRVGDGRIETSFDNLLVKYSAGECAAASGSVTTKIFKEGSAEADRELKLTVTDGEVTLVDVSTGAEVEEFQFDACDPEDMAL